MQRIRIYFSSFSHLFDFRFVNARLKTILPSLLFLQKMDRKEFASTETILASIKSFDDLVDSFRSNLSVNLKLVRFTRLKRSTVNLSGDRIRKDSPRILLEPDRH